MLNLVKYTNLNIINKKMCNTSLTNLHICHALLYKYGLLTVYTVYGTMSIAVFTKTGMIFIIYALECKIHLLCEIK